MALPASVGSADSMAAFVAGLRFSVVVPTSPFTAAAACSSAASTVATWSRYGPRVSRALGVLVVVVGGAEAVEDVPAGSRPPPRRPGPTPPLHAAPSRMNTTSPRTTRRMATSISAWPHGDPRTAARPGSQVPLDGRGAPAPLRGDVHS